MSNTYKLRGKVAAITEPRTFPSGYTDTSYQNGVFAEEKEKRNA